MTTEYTLIRSKRKTIAAEVRAGELIVRAPNRCTKREIEAFLKKHGDWIDAHLAQSRAQQAQAQAAGRLTQEELDGLYRRAAEIIPQRVRYFAGLLGAEYGRVTIRCQKTRWGSCSAKKNLNFNCLLMLAPPEVIDAVVAHEVCHLIEMNHSDRFYALVTGLYPDYHRWNRWLKDNGKLLMSRAA